MVLAPLSNPRVLAGVTLVRVVVMFGYLAWQLGPIRAWQRRPDGDDGLLLAADRSLEQLPRRFAWAYLLAWVLAMSTTILLGHLGWPQPRPLGAVELLVAALRLLTMVIAMPVLLRPLLEHVLMRVQREVGEARRRRGLGPWPVTGSIGRSLVTFSLGFGAAALLGMSSLALQLRADGRRDTAMAEQRAR